MPATTEQEVNFLQRRIADLDGQLSAFKQQLAQAESQLSKPAPNEQNPRSEITDELYQALEADNSESSSFLRLPAELRNSIYELVLPQNRTLRVNRHTKTNNVGRIVADWHRSFLDRQSLQPALLYVCRQTRRETTPMFYLHNSFDVNVAETEDFMDLRKYNFARAESWLCNVPHAYRSQLRLTISVYPKRGGPVDTQRILRTILRVKHGVTLGHWFSAWFVDLRGMNLSFENPEWNDRHYYRVRWVGPR
ncbi:Hypothetical predicted protein [Lecanosticta acicola]|uniref:2EXR domain-containing protein n=1 Tax=Lecanosticta acicola TaxID=111012 RepID=A0AAI8Z215_9PEZI|nr:Hypothetical predicted protein [Lecanosticta acicola]